MPNVIQLVKNLFFAFCSLLLSEVYIMAMVNGKFGKIDSSATLTAEYDSRVFGISSNSFQGAKASVSPLIRTDRLKSEDDFIIRFSPALHFSKKIKWFQVSASAGVSISQYVKNDDLSHTEPITTISIDFDDTLSKSKRISNNSKIRFDATFDLGQKVGASVLEQDLITYTFFDVGLNVRYNHSPKFGVGGGTSYNVKYYQQGTTSERPYQDLSTLPLTARAFYIYSEKLDFYTDYTFSRTRDDQSGSATLSDSQSHTFSFGAQGDYSSKLSGNANLGYSFQHFENQSISKQDNLVSSLGVEWIFNVKTSIGFDLSRAFSPSAQGFSSFGTTSRVSLNHRFTEKVRGLGYFSLGSSEYTYASVRSSVRDSSSINFYGFGINISKAISSKFSANGGYDYTLIDRGSETYGRHLLKAEITGRF
jgi:hypothetical protein